MRVIGVDPGLTATGYGVLDVGQGTPLVRAYGCPRSDSGQPLEARLRTIYEALLAVLAEWKPGRDGAGGVCSGLQVPPHRHRHGPRPRGDLPGRQPARRAHAGGLSGRGEERPHRLRPGQQGADPARRHPDAATSPPPRRTSTSATPSPSPWSAPRERARTCEPPTRHSLLR